MTFTQGEKILCDVLTGAHQAHPWKQQLSVPRQKSMQRICKLIFVKTYYSSKFVNLNINTGSVGDPDPVPDPNLFAALPDTDFFTASSRSGP